MCAGPPPFRPSPFATCPRAANTDPNRDGQPAPLPCSGAEGDPSWGTVYPTITWGVWKQYGATGVAARHYPSLLRYMAMLEAAVNSTGLHAIFCQWGAWRTARMRGEQRTRCALPS